jgi:hypothetical protein
MLIIVTKKLYLGFVSQLKQGSFLILSYISLSELFFCAGRFPAGPYNKTSLPFAAVLKYDIVVMLQS